jgi:serine/threonine protein kinase
MSLTPTTSLPVWSGSGFAGFFRRRCYRGPAELAVAKGHVGLGAVLKDRYAVMRPLGAGGMATVYLAEDLMYQRRVAIKVLHPELSVTIAANRFLREIRLTAKLQHPHILTLIDSGDIDGILYYVMPYVDGVSLRKKLSDRQLMPLEEVIHTASRLASALDHAHRRGVIHRDIKPENILFQDGHPILADFGVALAVGSATEEQLTKSGLAVGTPAYMSPEQAAGMRQLDGRSDVYSLACVLYEMLIGTPLFTATTPRTVLASQMAGSLPSVRAERPEVPGSIEAVLHRALARRPVDRHASAAELESALEATLIVAQRPRRSPMRWLHRIM